MVTRFTGAISATHYLTGSGEMAQLIRSRDWAKTPLGPIEFWPQSLLTTISLCLGSNFPINIIWGPKHIQIYNDGYCVVCGDAHPSALGQGYDVTWASAWPVIGEPFARALAGETSYLENQRMFLTRNGYLEETFFTFSLSPIRDESGGIGGLFHPVTETTATMLAERRTRALRDLTAALGTVPAVSRLGPEMTRVLADFAFDLPFMLVYEFDKSCYVLTASYGMETGSAASPPELSVASDEPWPVRRAADRGCIVEARNISALLEGTGCGPYEEPPGMAFVLPVVLPGVDQPPAVLIIGASSRLPMDDAYRGFYDLVGSAICAAFATVRAHADERRRAEALAALDHAKTVFFSNVSHEFRTPLSLMLGPLEDVLGDAAPLTAPQRQKLEVAYRNALRLLRLVNTLLDFSRIEAGRVEARYEPVDLAAATTELVANFESAFTLAGLSLTVDCPKSSHMIAVDRAMWEKIVLNLVSNAFKFTLEGGAAIALREVGPDIELTVSDTGVGVPASELPRLFERFHRIEGQAARTHEGTGIGLALVQELVALHHGSITADSVEGRGTTFRITLPSGLTPVVAARQSVETPLAPPPAIAFVEEALHWLADPGPDAPPASASGEADRTRLAGVPRILIADDNADMRAYIRRILEDGGYAVVAVANGAAALQALRQIPLPALVLTDVMMPELDGFQFLKALRADPALENLLVIMLSARAGDEARIEGLEAGADDYLVKPFGARELCARVDGAVRLGRQRQEAAARERALETRLATARSLADLHEREQQLDLALKAGRLGSWELDLTTGTLVASEICRANHHWDATETYTYERLLDCTFPADRLMLEQRVREAIENHANLDIEYRTVLPDGDAGWIMMRGRAAYAADGTAVSISGVSLDITERKKVEQQQRLLLDELNHRVKNTLATVQSIAWQTRRTTRDPNSFGEALEARIAALARAHDILTGSAWEGAMLDDVLTQTLAPYARPDGGADRIGLHGPPVRLGPNAAVTLNMAFHELATNAAKFGSLSAPDGRLDVTWTSDRSTPLAMLDIVWTEAGGPSVSPPSRTGFGTRLLRTALPRELGGFVTLDFEPGGLRCHLKVATSHKLAVLH